MATAKELIKVAQAEVGYLEKKSNSNLSDKTANAGDKNYTKYAQDFDTKYPNFYNGRKNGFEWCSVFVAWCFVTAFGVDKALALLGQPTQSLGASCKYAANYYKKMNAFHVSPEVGDQIFFKDSKGDVCHTGIVYQVDNIYVYTIEGNTSSESGVVANGGAVAYKKYNKAYSRIYGYGRPKYDAELPKSESSSKKNVVLEWQNAAMADGFKQPKYFTKCGADGEWGSECEDVAKKAVCKKRLTYQYKNLTKIVQKAVGFTGNDIDGKFGSDTKKAVIAYQKAHGLTADGEVGLNTWKKILGV